MAKHAFLIAAHHQYPLLETLLRLLDHPQNDIFLHISQTAPEYDKEQFRSVLKHSKLQFVRRIKVMWGGSSQIEYELELLKAAVKGNYAYYHMISGVDLPIKPMAVIHQFFEEHAGKEFIHFGTPEYTNSPAIRARISVYHPLQNVVGRNKGPLLYVEKVLVKLQKILGVNRIRGKEATFGFGSNWFSITHDFASFLVERENEIRKRFGYSFCADEVFLQTMFKESPQRENRYIYEADESNAYMSCVRYVDWERGKPYVFRSEDFEDLIQSPYLFARKFDLNEDPQIVERIYNHFKENCHEEV